MAPRSTHSAQIPKGVSYFGADGRFFVFLSRGDLPKIASNDRTKATPQEAKAIMDAAIAYSGTYTIDEASKTISYRIEVTTFPNQAVEQKRLITSLTANELTHYQPHRDSRQIEIKFKRATSGGHKLRRNHLSAGPARLGRGYSPSRR